MFAQQFHSNVGDIVRVFHYCQKTPASGDWLIQCPVAVVLIRFGISDKQ
jgi:hypothetical protein